MASIPQHGSAARMAVIVLLLGAAAIGCDEPAPPADAAVMLDEKAIELPVVSEEALDAPKPPPIEPPDLSHIKGGWMEDAGEPDPRPRAPGSPTPRLRLYVSLDGVVISRRAIVDWWERLEFPDDDGDYDSLSARFATWKGKRKAAAALEEFGFDFDEPVVELMQFEDGRVPAGEDGAALFEALEREQRALQELFVHVHSFRSEDDIDLFADARAPLDTLQQIIGAAQAARFDTPDIRVRTSQGAEPLILPVREIVASMGGASHLLEGVAEARAPRGAAGFDEMCALPWVHLFGQGINVGLSAHEGNWVPLDIYVEQVYASAVLGKGGEGEEAPTTNSFPWPRRDLGWLRLQPDSLPAWHARLVVPDAETCPTVPPDEGRWNLERLADFLERVGADKTFCDTALLSFAPEQDVAWGEAIDAVEVVRRQTGAALFVQWGRMLGRKGPVAEASCSGAYPL